MNIFDIFNAFFEKKNKSKIKKNVKNTHNKHRHYNHNEHKECIDSRGYEELLKTKEWADKRKKILERDNYECQICHQKFNVMNVHHKYYLRESHKRVMPWEYDDDALITLCPSCHTKLHSSEDIMVYKRGRNGKIYFDSGKIHHKKNEK